MTASGMASTSADPAGIVVADPGHRQPPPLDQLGRGVAEPAEERQAELDVGADRRPSEEAAPAHGHCGGDGSRRRGPSPARPAVIRSWNRFASVRA